MVAPLSEKDSVDPPTLSNPSGFVKLFFGARCVKGDIGSLGFSKGYPPLNPKEPRLLYSSIQGLKKPFLNIYYFYNISINNFDQECFIPTQGE
jgi:hypothetical protein